MFKSVRKKRDKAIKMIRSKQGSTTKELLLLKTNKYIYVQLIDKLSKKTVLTVSSLGFKEDIAKLGVPMKSVKSSELIGQKMGQFCKDNGFAMPSFNRAGYKFHGLIKAVKVGFDNVFLSNN